MEESESSLEDGSDESYFLCLRRLLFLSCLFFFDIESDEDVFDDESDDDGSGSRLSGLCPFLFFEISVDFVCELSVNEVTKSVCRVSGMFSV